MFAAFRKTAMSALTDSQPPGWTSYARRVDAEMLAEVAPSPTERPRLYACGPTPFVEAVAEALVQLGHDPLAIKTERFGPPEAEMLGCLGLAQSASGGGASARRLADPSQGRDERRSLHPRGRP
jgi:ferredoxin-NADP reductase